MSTEARRRVADGGVRLLLCDRGDLPALWAYRRLAQRGVALELVSADVLVHALRWEHRLGAAGDSVRIALAGGRTIDGDRVRAVLNRVTALPGGDPAQAGTDRDYAAQERIALFLSWLRALPAPVLNLPTPDGLCGPWLRLPEWLVLAARAGLPAPPYRRSAAHPADEGPPAWLPGRGPAVLVVGGRTTRAPAEVTAACLRLAELARVQTLGVQFRPSPAGRWTFARATPLPSFQLWGDEAVDLLEAALQPDA